MPSDPHREGEPRADRPRTNADPREVQRKLALLDEPHIKPLSDFVRDLRQQRGGDLIPWFDPTEAGVAARILMLLEAPGRKAAPGQGSGFISPDNNDGSAQNMWNLLREAGVNRRREIVTWNVIPWYIGSVSRIRAASGDDIREAHEALVRLLRLLADLRVVLLLGKPAAEAWQLVGVELPTITAPHPSPKNLNSRSHYRPLILQALHEARQRAGYTDRAQPVGPSPVRTERKVDHESDSEGGPEVADTGKRVAASPVNRAAIRDSLRAGLTPDQVFATSGRTRAVYLAAIEEEARLEGELNAFAATPENVVMLRDGRQFRWERIAVRVFGDARQVVSVRGLYDEAKGRGASERSYTGRGRRFPKMD